MSSQSQHAMALPYVESERDTFFRILFHDDRKSFYILSTDATGKWEDTAVRRDQLALVSFNNTSNYYITHNGFTEKRRKIERTRQLNALFFDMDCHGSNHEECKQLIGQAISKINDAVSTGSLPNPSLIVDSGRGIHVYYVLERSIPYRFRGKGEINEKGISFFKRVQRQLASVLEETLDGLPGIELDRAVFDHTRVARIPGTFNPKAGRSARLVAFQEAYHQLSDLASYKPVNAAPQQVPQKKRKAVILTFHPLMMSRLTKVAELQAYRNYGCEGTRELMGFVYYNTAVQVYSREDAKERLVAFNDAFKKPLGQKELEGITKAVDEVVNVKGEKGHYILSAHKVVELLAMTDKEMEETHFFASKRMMDRMEAKRKTKEKREARNQRIVELYQSGEMTQQEVANEVGCSLRTVQSVLKANGVQKRITAVMPAYVAPAEPSMPADDALRNVSHVTKADATPELVAIQPEESSHTIQCATFCPTCLLVVNEKNTDKKLDRSSVGCLGPLASLPDVARLALQSDCVSFGALVFDSSHSPTLSTEAHPALPDGFVGDDPPSVSDSA